MGGDVEAAGVEARVEIAERRMFMAPPRVQLTTAGVTAAPRERGRDTRRGADRVVVDLMGDTPGTRLSAGAWVLAPILAALTLAALLATGADPSIFGKEQWVEHASHVVLLASLAAWALAAARDRGPGALLMVPFLALVLCEELDWGEVYQELAPALVSPRRWVRAWTGRPDLHNSFQGHSYLLFAVPVLILAALPLVPARLRPLSERLWGRIQPTRAELVAIFAVVAVHALLAILDPSLERALDETKELVLYAWLLPIALRGALRRAPAPATAPRPPRS